MDLSLFESFYRRVGGEVDLSLYSGATFGEYTDDNSGYTYDTAMTFNGVLYGPRRFINVYDGQRIVTRTYKNGRLHGLSIEVWSNKIEV